MKKLIYKIISLCSIILIFVMILSLIFTPFFKDKNYEYINMPHKITLANTGSSHGVHAFDYSVYNGEAFNFAMDSQSIQYDNNLLEYYVDHFEKDSVVLIPISYFTFWSDELKSDTFDDQNQRYFSVLDADHMRFKSKTEFYINKYISAIQIADKQTNSVFINKKVIAEANVQKTNFTREEIGEKRATFHLSDIQNDNKLLPMNPSAEDSLISMIKLCKQKNITPILITTPYMYYYSKWFSNDFFNEFYDEINKVCDEYNVIYLDYSKDKHFAYEEELFNDTDHLSKKGAKVFTKIVIDDLKKNNLLKE